MKDTWDAAAAVQSVAGRKDLVPQEKIRQLLAHGNSLFKTSSALVSHVQGSKYVIVYCVSEEAEVDPGTAFELEDTYCIHTLQADGPLAFHNASQSEIGGHPCYNMFQLETYIGAPIKFGNAAWGTVNFTAIDPREPFKGWELEMMAALSEAVAKELVACGQAATVHSGDKVT